MKKKLYDFSLGTAIIILSAYLIAILFIGYSAFSGEEVHILSLVLFILLIVSLVIVIWYYVILVVFIDEKGVRHGKNLFIKDVKYSIVYNQRFRYNELIFRNKYVNYDKLSKKDLKKKQIIVQYFPKYEQILKTYFAKK